MLGRCVSPTARVVDVRPPTERTGFFIARTAAPTTQTHPKSETGRGSWAALFGLGTDQEQRPDCRVHPTVPVLPPLVGADIGIEQIRRLLLCESGRPSLRHDEVGFRRPGDPSQ